MSIYSIGMKTQTKWIFYLLLTIPFFWIGYRSFTDDLGAQPAETINKLLGDYTLYLLLANLYWGCFDALFDSSWLRRWTPLRRPLGVATFLYALLHLSSYFLREGDFSLALKQMTEKVYLLFGLSGLFLLFLLAATSNNWSVRWLKFKKWKQLHRLVYLAFFLISIHILLIEKRSPLTNKYTLFPMAGVLIFRFCQSLRRSWGQKTKNQKKV